VDWLAGCFVIQVYSIVQLVCGCGRLFGFLLVLRLE